MPATSPKILRSGSAGIQRERVEAPAGAAGQSTWTPVVGCADETSAHGRRCGLSVGRSSRRQPLTTGGPGGAGPPLGGEAHVPLLPGGSSLLSSRRGLTIEGLQVCPKEIRTLQMHRCHLALL